MILISSDIFHCNKKKKTKFYHFYQYVQITHWNSPFFHAYFPTANSYPAIVAEILSSAIGCIGFSWIASPACTELEVITCNWLGKLLGLPDEFLNHSNGTGGGVIQVIAK